MRNTQESGQISQSKKRPRRTLRSGRGSRTNSNTSRQIPARVIDAAYDTLPPTDLNRPADYFRPELFVGQKSRDVIIHARSKMQLGRSDRGSGLLAERQREKLWGGRPIWSDLLVMVHGP